jgi:quercetin dioxygenase-like cupin family protein
MTPPYDPTGAAPTRTPGVLSGNAATGDPARDGWFVGHFLTGPTDPRATSTLEVKWAVYHGGETRAHWAANRQATTLAVLVRGRFRLRFPGREVLLAAEGDYALWEPGVPHHWTAETAAIVLTVRWPSVPDDSLAVPDPNLLDPIPPPLPT